MSVKILHLVSGNEWLADVEEDLLDSNAWVLKNPIRPLIAEAPGGMGISFVPVCLLAGEDPTELKISKSHVIAIFEPDESLKNGYCQKFGKIITGVGHIKLS
jgi:hypothetical protein